MTWFTELIEAYRTNAARMFILHFNVDDYIFDEHGTVTRIVPYLQHFGRGLHNPFRMYRYSTSMPTSISDDADGEWRRADDENARHAFQLAAGHGRWAATGGGLPPLEDPERVLRTIEAIVRDDTERSMVFIEHLEYLAPRAESSRGAQDTNVEILRRLANDIVFRRSQNMLVMITRELGAIDPGIYAPGSSCVPIQVPLPTKQDRRRLLDTMQQRRVQVAAGAYQPISRRPISALAEPEAELVALAAVAAPAAPDPIDLIAGLTEGFRLVEIDQLNREALARGLMARTRQEIRLDDILQLKRRAIREQSGGILEIVDAKRGFDAIGGMEIAKQYLRTVQVAIGQAATNDAALPLVPRGIILAGPPGTGKTIIAEALAHESGLNMVKLRNIRQQWVGSSERNLTRAFELIRALSPILVFVDEIDQAFGSRGVGSTNDGGTSERLFGMTLEFIGDERNRGRVIWVAATNRPDTLDAALLRRFDRVIPCLLPTPEEQLLILDALPRTLSLTFDAELHAMIHGRDQQLLALFADRAGMVPTGAVIEAIGRRAIEIARLRPPPAPPTLPLGATHPIGAPTIRLVAPVAAVSVTLADLRQAVDDYRSNANQDEYDFQSLLAVRACNFYSVMPPLPPRPPFSGIAQPRARRAGGTVPACWQDDEIVYSRLDDAIEQLRLKLRQR